MKFNFPKKRIAAGALILNKNKVLITKAGYKNHWSFPGGIVEEFESPKDCAKRETKEEIGLDIEVVRPLTIQYLKRRDEGGINEGGINESIQMLFLCKLVKGEKFSDIKFIDGETTEHKFVLPKMVPKMISKWGAKRWKSVIEALRENKVIYLENKYKK